MERNKFRGNFICKNINDFKNIKRKNIRIIQYEGKNKLNTIREDTGDKGYAIAFENIIKYINTIIPKNEVIEEALRKEISMYPELAIREAVANSLVHRLSEASDNLCYAK